MQPLPHQQARGVPLGANPAPCALAPAFPCQAMETVNGQAQQAFACSCSYKCDSEHIHVSSAGTPGQTHAAPSLTPPASQSPRPSWLFHANCGTMAWGERC